MTIHLSIIVLIFLMAVTLACGITKNILTKKMAIWTVLFSILTYFFEFVITLR